LLSLADASTFARMYGDRSSRVATIRRTAVHTNLEAIAIMLATGFAGQSLVEGALIVVFFAVCTALHLASHFAVAAAFGKGIDRMVLTRAGRIDYAGGPPRFAEALARTAAGATMNALCAVAGYALLATTDIHQWPPLAALALRTFASCSLILTVINFLPAIPLDGGLILQLVLARVLRVARAQRVSAIISLCLMCAMAFIGVWLLQPVLVYLAFVISYDNWRKHLR
jgi:stage IV sporulation protein FB